MKTLYILRHAKSSWKDFSLDDIDRPLNKRGKRDAPRMGAWLRDWGLQLDVVLSSPAKRARKTAEKVCLELGDYTVSKEQRLYFENAGGMDGVIHDLPNSVNSALLVGHNPECTETANLLTGSNIYNIPTCGIVGIKFVLSIWQEVGPGSGELILFEYPKKITSL